MSATWPNIQGALESAFKCATGLSANWEHEKAIALCPPFGMLRISAHRNVGYDETSYTYDATDDDIKVKQTGIREFVLQMQVESDSFSPCSAAWHYLELARTRLRMSGARGILNPCGIAIVSMSPLQNLDYARDGRWVSRAALDVVMSTSTTVDDCPITYIETCKVSSNLTDCSGAAVGSALQWNDKVI